MKMPEFLISLKFVPRSPIDNKSALVQMMAWRWTDDKPLPEPMLTLFATACQIYLVGKYCQDES